MDLARKYRPSSLKTIIGQKALVKTVSVMIERKKYPPTMLLTGPSGCGKTTIARIIKKEMGVHDMDWHEINAAKSRGIDLVRDIESGCRRATMGGGPRLYMIDEAHRLTGEAQDCFLKVLEEPPKNVHFILVTTDPKKLILTIRTRCQELKVESLTAQEIESLLLKVIKKEEGTEPSEIVLSKIVEASEGSARRALNLLESVMRCSDEADQLKVIARPAEEQEAIDLCRILIKENSTWREVAAVLKGLKEDPESIRYAVLGYCAAIALNRPTKRLALILECFQDNFYDSKKAGLTLACLKLYPKALGK